MTLSRQALLLFAAAALAVAGYAMMRPPAPAQHATTPSNARFELIDAGDASTRGPIWQLREGSQVEIWVTSSEPGALMVHGQTDTIPVAPGSRVAVRFVASATGRFALHHHGQGGSHRELARLEVLPH